MEARIIKSTSVSSAISDDIRNASDLMGLGKKLICYDWGGPHWSDTN